MSEPLVETRRAELPGGHWVEAVIELDLSVLDDPDGLSLKPILRGVRHSVGVDARTAAAACVALVRGFSEDVVARLGFGRVDGVTS